MLQIMPRLTTKSSAVYIPCEKLLRCLGDHGKKISVRVLNTDAAFLGISWCPLSHFNICGDFNSVLNKTTRTQEMVFCSLELTKFHLSSYKRHMQGVPNEDAQGQRQCLKSFQTVIILQSFHLS